MRVSNLPRERGYREAARQVLARLTPDVTSVVKTRPAAGVVLLRIASQPLGVLRADVKAALAGALDSVEMDPDVRCVVLTGDGSAFSVGSDIREFSTDPLFQKQMAETDQALNDCLEFSRLPVIAACNGHTLGGGLELALACDMRLASESATFGFPEVKVGSIASAGGTQRLPSTVSRGAAARLLLTGATIGAKEAAAIGLVDQVTRDADLEATAINLALVIAANPTLAVAATKRCLVAGQRFGRVEGYALEQELGRVVGMGKNAQEAQLAFLSKRDARFADDLDEWLAWSEGGLM